MRPGDIWSGDYIVARLSDFSKAYGLRMGAPRAGSVLLCSTKRVPEVKKPAGWTHWEFPLAPAMIEAFFRPKTAVGDPVQLAPSDDGSDDDDDGDSDDSSAPPRQEELQLRVAEEGIVTQGRPIKRAYLVKQSPYFKNYRRMTFGLRPRPRNRRKATDCGPSCGSADAPPPPLDQCREPGG